MGKLKKQNAITLVALVITIVVLLILAGISISALTNTGIFAKAKDAKKKFEDVELEQNTELDSYEKEISNYLPERKTVKQAIKECENGNPLSTDKNIELIDEKENKMVVPAGFIVVAEATTVDKGIVIEDVTENATKGSQFVWVPVGNITKEDGTITEIELNRYTFASDGTPTEQNKSVIENFYQELAVSDKGNIVAKNISEFQSSVKKNSGYYISRYEAGITGYDENNITTSNINEEANWTGYTSANGKQLQLVCKANQQVWNYITQNKAGELSQDMYKESTKFKSDLINSYAWDTAITFIQKCSDEINYANQNSLNSGSLPEQTGTTKDNSCNIFDIASNVCEWVTETSNISGYPCVRRGGSYYNKDNYTCFRYSYDTPYNFVSLGFRPILYINNN